MVAIPINCANCGESGGRYPKSFDSEGKYYYNFPHIKITRHEKSCETCHHSDTTEIFYYFCCIDCLRQWVIKHKDGFPCLSCEGTGDENAYMKKWEIDTGNPIPVSNREIKKCKYCDNGLIKT